MGTVPLSLFLCFFQDTNSGEESPRASFVVAARIHDRLALYQLTSLRQTSSLDVQRTVETAFRAVQNFNRVVSSWALLVHRNYRDLSHTERYEAAHGDPEHDRRCGDRVAAVGTDMEMDQTTVVPIQGFNIHDLSLPGINKTLRL